MKNINEYNEYGVYNVSDIINSFPDIFNITLPNLTAEFLLTNKKIISKKEITNYCINNFNNLNESKNRNNIDNDIIESRLKDYEIFKKIIDIYKQKGLAILDILIYLNQNKLNKQYEKLLNELDIDHYKSIICGRDLIRILNALNNIIKNYNKTINIINNLNTYNNIHYDSFARLSNKLYPNNSLINNEDNYDNTSLALTKKKIKYV